MPENLGLKARMRSVKFKASTPRRTQSAARIGAGPRIRGEFSFSTEKTIPVILTISVAA
jgi:hypothetical protein